MVFSLLKNEILKHADFASEWRKSCFRGLEIKKSFRERMPLHPLLGHCLWWPNFLEPPVLKTWILVNMEQYSAIQVLRCLLIFSRPYQVFFLKKGSGMEGVVLYRVCLRGFLFQTGAGLVVCIYLFLTSNSNFKTTPNLQNVQFP